MRARPFLRAVAITGFLVSVSTRALAAGDEPESVPAIPAPSSSTTTTTGDSGTIVTPIGSVETTTVQAPPPVEAAAPAKPIPLITERTAYMVGNHTLQLGILAFEYGIMQQLSIGTEPPAWLLRTVISVLIPNLHLKFQILDRDPVAVAVQAAGYYATLDRNDISGTLIDVPISLFVSVKVHPRITLHATGAYIYARVIGTGDVTKASLDGASAGSAGQVGLMLQYRLTRIFSLTAIGRYQFWVSDLPLSGSSMIDPYTTATLSGQFVPGVQHPWEAIGGIAVLWHYIHLTLGAGYGYYFVPGLDIANTKKTVVPDANIAVVL
jgi:hypothetical protein